MTLKQPSRVMGAGLKSRCFQRTSSWRSTFTGHSKRKWRTVSLTPDSSQFSESWRPQRPKLTTNISTIYASAGFCDPVHNLGHRRKLVKNIGGLIAFLLPLPSHPVPEFFYMQLNLIKTNVHLLGIF